MSTDSPAVKAATDGILARLTWASMHWGTEGVHPDAWPHIAKAAIDAAAPHLRPMLGLDTLRVEGTWLVEVMGDCTCGAGGAVGHERGCGLEPVIDLSTLPGWTVHAAGYSTEAPR